jgi:hypothetical protein
MRAKRESQTLVTALAAGGWVAAFDPRREGA